MADSDGMTTLLGRVERGEAGAADELFRLAYDELRAHASRQLRSVRHGGPLNTTALVNEAYIRLFRDAPTSWAGRKHFYFAAARAMHDVLVEDIRARAAAKRGGGRRAVPLDLDGIVAPPGVDANILGVSEALAALREHDPACADLVLLRFFGGLTFNQIAEALQCSPSSIHRTWAYAQAWLRRRMEADGK